MADTIRLVDYFCIETSDRPGEGARALSMLKDAGGRHHGPVRKSRAVMKPISLDIV